MWLLGGSVFPMRSVGIEALHNRLADYVRMAASGETILVTDRDRVVAEIRPPQITGSPALADNGWMMPPVSSAGGAPPPSKPVAPLRELLTEPEDDRSER